MIRETCGTRAGLMAHQSAGERPCGWCDYAQQARRIAAEGIPSRPTPPGWLPPVSAEQAAHNAALLHSEVIAAEVAAKVANRERRHLRAVPAATPEHPRRSA